VGGARPPPLITFTLTSKVSVYAPAVWAETLTLFHLYQYMYSVVLHPQQRRGVHSTHSPGGEGDGGSIFWKTREIGLPLQQNMYSVVRALGSTKSYLYFPPFCQICLHSRSFSLSIFYISFSPIFLFAKFDVYTM